MATKELTRHQVRWAEKLSEFNFVIIPRPGKQNGKADALTQMAGSKPLNAQDEWKQFQQMTLLAPDKFSVSCVDIPEELVEVVDEPNNVIQSLFEQI